MSLAGYADHQGNWRDVWRQAALRLRQLHHLAELFTKPQPKVVTV
ncbi:hypothetical protein [Nostoc sp. S13]|nr:hypothetical protein [Nostoc sp. S13]MDF5740189.1 hypothetical protein [Nostoc sp. S13]